MFTELARVGLLVGAILAPTAMAAPADPGDCNRDSKLIGLIEVSTDDRDGTWWSITKDGLDAAGFTDYKAALEMLFGTTFSTLGQAVQVVVDAVRPFDKNGNGYVCAFSLRGTRAYLGDPLYAHYYFGIDDDKHVDQNDNK